MQSASTQSASQAVDGNWSFNNMQTDNVTGGKWVQLLLANGQMTAQTNNGALVLTQTAGGGGVHNSSAMSKLPVDINFGKAMSSTAQRLGQRE